MASLAGLVVFVRVYHCVYMGVPLCCRHITGLMRHLLHLLLVNVGCVKTQVMLTGEARYLDGIWGSSSQPQITPSSPNNPQTSP